MAELKSLPLAKITVPDNRSRLVNEDHALAIQASIVEHGLLQPIVVRRTPNGATPYTLIAGAHRLHAVTLLDEPEIECVVVAAGKVDAILMEVTENLFRNDMTVLDRAQAVLAYRSAWEEKHGHIRTGPKGDQVVSDKLSLIERPTIPDLPESPLDAIADEAERGFSEVCAERMGLSKRAIERLVRIARHLPADLRAALSPTVYADNQALLLRFATLVPAVRAKALATLEAEDGDAMAAIAILEGKGPDRRSAQQKIEERIEEAWGRATASTRRSFFERWISTDPEAKAWLREMLG